MLCSKTALIPETCRYKGLVSQEFLDDKPLHFKNRYELWKKVTVNEKQVTFVAESKEHGVVGFINGTFGRDEEYKDYAEVWCIYLLEKYHGQKIGFNLLKSYFDTHAEFGYKKGYLWVLADNPTISFYEKVGGKFTGQTKDDEIDFLHIGFLGYDSINTDINSARYIKEHWLTTLKRENKKSLPYSARIDWFNTKSLNFFSKLGLKQKQVIIGA